MSVHHPMTIYMSDEWSCPTCITLQVLYMFGLERPPFDLAEIDQRIGRQPGQPIPGEGDLLELLRHGLTLIEIDGTDINTALGPNGYEYLVGYLSTQNPEFASRYTPGDFTQWRERLVNYYQQVSQLPGRLEILTKAPEAQDILHLFKRGCEVVILPLRTLVADETHLVLAYGVDDRGHILLYSPQLRGSREPLLQTMTLADIDTQLASYDGIIGVGISL